MRNIVTAMVTALCTTPALATPSVSPYTLAAKACEQSDMFVHHAILDYVKELHPNHSVEIDRFVANDCQHTQKATPQHSQSAAKTSDDHTLLSWSRDITADGELEAAASWETGDTEQRSLFFRGKLNHSHDRLRNTLEGSARNDQENNENTAEEYRLSLRSDYKLTQHLFAFGKLAYVDDRFSGFDYRLSELAGLGYILYDDESFYWETRLGAGARQDKLTNSDKETSYLATWENDLNWAIAENWILGEKTSFAFTGNSDIYDSETSLKSTITDTLAVKATYFIEYIDGPPDDTKNTDTRTTLGVVYSF